MLYNEDCLTALKKIQNNEIDMIYLDPPFYTQRKQKLSNSEGKQYEFSDIWKSRQEYLNYMRERLIEMKRILKTTGNLFLHCDSSASHYLRVILDEVFGEENFRSEIIWTYKRWSNSKKGLLPAHQTIFWYSKSNKFKFNVQYNDYSPTTNLDQILQERQRNSSGKTVYKKDDNGEIVHAKEKKGVPMSDVWEIPYLNPKAKERTGYPTQKPIELLERIINISTDECDLVLDPFCGSGTTLVASELLNRRYIGMDISKEAISLTEERLKNPFKTDSILLKIGKDSYKTKNEEELAILKQFDCDIVQRNKGIDAFLKKYYLDAPVAVRIQREGESIIDAMSLLNNAATKKKCSFMILISNEIIDEVIPGNMIIIPKYSILAENLMSKISL